MMYWWVCDLHFVCNLYLSRYMSCYMISLCRRVCVVSVVPQVLIYLLYIDSYASVYGIIDVLRGSGNSMPFDCVA